MGGAMFDRLKRALSELTRANKFDKPDFAVLKTMLMLAAVDGEVSPDEIESFRGLAEKCRGYNDESFETLWESALHSAGYLLLQSRLLDRDALAAAFVREAEGGFVGEIIQEESESRNRAFDCLVKMASADGDYSSVERACIEALTRRVKEARDRMIAERYPRAAAFGK